MTEVEIRAGICGFTTRIGATCSDGQMVDVTMDSECPSLARANGSLGSFDAYSELFRPLAGSEVFAKLSQVQKHPACPVISGALKAMEVAAGLALPRAATIEFVSTPAG